MQQRLFFILGWITLILAILGWLLPILPGTPFIILSIFFFEKGSPRLHHWLIHHKYVGPWLMEWEQKHRMKMSTKLFLSFIIFCAFGVSMLSPRLAWWGKTMLGTTAFSLIVWILTRKNPTGK